MSNQVIENAYRLRCEYEILRIQDLCKLLKRSRAGIYMALNPSSTSYEPDFPKQIKLSARSVGWLASEVYAYIDLLSGREGAK